MAQLTLRPNGNGALSDWSNDDYTRLNDQSDSTVASTPSNNQITTYLMDNTGLSGVTINWIRIRLRARSFTSGSNTIQGVLRISSTNYFTATKTTATALAWYEEDFATSPATSAAWTISELDALEAGFKSISVATFTQLQVADLEILVDYSTGNHPSPTSPECEGESQPTDASDDPVFSAIWQATGGSGTATHAYVQVSEVSDFSTTKWDSGWIDISDIGHNTRCGVIDYNGSALSSEPPNGWYYWRIKFKDGSATESEWSATAQFKGLKRAWWNAAYAFRKKLLLNTNHPDVPSGSPIIFSLKTGNRQRIATNGCFNEAIQEAGNMIAEFGNKLHIVYLSETGSDTKYGIYVQSYDKTAKVWGTPYKIDDAKTDFDTHNYPTLCIDNNGILHVFYGCHNSACYYRKSRVSNQSGAFAGEGDEFGVWTGSVTLGSDLSYPMPFVVKSTNRIVLIARGGDEKKIYMFYSTNGGGSWSSAKTVIDNNGGAAYRTYCYGCRVDPNTDRLHLGFSFIKTNNITEGVWYAYADFEAGQADGYVNWKMIDGTSCGTTVTSPVNRSSAGAVKLNDTSDRVIYFCRHIVLTKTGKPLVYWAYAPDLDVWGQEASFSVSRWTGSAWAHKWITEDYGLRMRTDRAGVPSLTDADGTIHTFTAVDSVLEYHQQPTANGNYTSLTLTGAATLYECVDDGIDIYDAGDTMAYTTGAARASVTSSKTLPAGVTVLAVGVEVIIMDVTSGASFNAFLRTSSVDYDSGAFSSTQAAYKIHRQWWTTNPATGQPWTKSQAEAQEVGIYQSVAGKSWRVTRINRLVKVRHAASAYNFASEIIELTSSDEGANWSWRRLTENSWLGVPILSIKHQLTNRTIDLVWTSGNDVFVLGGKPFGEIRRDGRDLRVVLQGNAYTEELNRVINYADFDNTIVTLKLPHVISAGKRAGVKDIYVYWGNPNVADDALSDPNQVFTFFENWEAFGDGDNIHGVVGWSVTDGTGTIYASPPNHNNKVFAGSNSLSTPDSGGAFTAEKSLEAADANFQLEGAIWLENPTGLIYLQVVDGSGNVFSAGVNATTKYAAYEDSGGWHDHATKRVTAKSMVRVRIAVTASGCSAWINDVQIADEVAAITSVSKVRCKANNYGYFDFLRGSKRLERRRNQTITSGFTDNTISFSSGHTETYESTADGKHDISTNNIYRVEVKVRARNNGVDFAWVDTHVWLSSGTSYNSATVVGNQTVRLDNLAEGGAWVSATLTFDNLTIGNYSAKVDYYARSGSSINVTVEIESIKIYYWDYDPVVELQAEESRGFGLKMALLGVGVDQFYLNCKLGGYFLSVKERIRIEALKKVAALERCVMEISKSLASAIALQVETLKQFQLAQRIPVDSQAGIEHKTTLPTESQRTVRTGEKVYAEWLAQVRHGTTLPVDSLASIEIRSLLSTEYRGTTALIMTLPIEYLRSLKALSGLTTEFLRTTIVLESLPVEATAQVVQATELPLEVRGGLALIMIAPVEFQRSMAVAARSVVEVNRMIAEHVITPVETLRAVRAVTALPIEYSGTVIVSSSERLPVEFTGTISTLAMLPLESNRTVAGINRIPVEFVGQLRVNADCAIEYLATCGAFEKLHVESLTKISAATQLYAETLRLFAAAERIPIEWRSAVALAQQLAIEWTGQKEISLATSMPVEWAASIDASGRMAVETLGARTIRTLLAIEAQKEIAATLGVPVEWRASIAAIMSRLSVEWAARISAQSSLRIETGALIAANVQSQVETLIRVVGTTPMPVEFGGAKLINLGMQLPVEWQATLAVRERLPIELRASIQILGGALLIETGRQFAAANRLTVEYGQRVLQAQRLLAEWVATVGATATMSIEYTSPVTGSMTLAVEYGRGVVTQTTLSIERVLKIIESEKLPIDYIGVFIATLCIAEARLLVPGLSGVTLRTPGLAEVLLRAGMLTGSELRTAELTESIARTAELLQAEILKGRSCQ